MTDKLNAFIDAGWYCKRYPDVKKSGLTPREHYLKYGERLGRKPNPQFDPLFYAEHNPDVVEAGVSLLTHFATFGKDEGRRGHAETVLEYMQQLWRREYIADCLSALVDFSDSNNPEEVRSACWQLARWYAWLEDWHCCALWLRSYYQQPPPKTPWPVVQLLYCESLCRIGELSEAEYQAEVLLERFPTYYDACLASSNVYLSQSATLSLGHEVPEQASALKKRRIDIVNFIFSAYGLTQIKLIDHSDVLSLDTTQSVSVTENERTSEKLETCDGREALVSVIVPVFNAEVFLETALKSLMAQSYSNLEVLIVDDASTDPTRAVAEKITAQDARFKLLCLPYNQGAYAARNHGLKHANGAYITVHDADDWSHPDKIACQVSAFEDHPSWVANTSDMVRCTTDLRFGRWRLPNAPYEGWIYRNTSSLIFKRQVFEALGYWDRVRCTADTEYIHRIIAAFGGNAYGRVLKGVPLSFCRHQKFSLSQINPLHLITHEKGLRRDYLRAAKKWHASASQSVDLYLSDSPIERPFAAPILNLCT